MLCPHGDDRKIAHGSPIFPVTGRVLCDKPRQRFFLKLYEVKFRSKTRAEMLLEGRHRDPAIGRLVQLIGGIRPAEDTVRRRESFFERSRQLLCTLRNGDVDDLRA
jgi:hypothetical protein